MTSTAEKERWLKQALKGGWDVPLAERGDCLRACVASLLGLPLERFGNPQGERWFEGWQDELAGFGYCLAEMRTEWDPPDGLLWIASVPSLNIPPWPDDGTPARHTIVVKGREFIHDPAIGSRQYGPNEWVEAWNEKRVTHGYLIAPIDPAFRKGSA